MRVMIKFAIPVEAGNGPVCGGKLQKVSQQIVEDLKPGAGYFFLDDGLRAGIFVVDMRESSQVVEIVERFFFGMNASIEMAPVMNADDLQKALSGVQGTIQRYGEAPSQSRFSSSSSRCSLS